MSSALKTRYSKLNIPTENSILKTQYSRLSPGMHPLQPPLGERFKDVVELEALLGERILHVRGHGAYHHAVDNFFLFEILQPVPQGSRIDAVFPSYLVETLLTAEQASNDPQVPALIQKIECRVNGTEQLVTVFFQLHGLCLFYGKRSKKYSAAGTDLL